MRQQQQQHLCCCPALMLQVSLGTQSSAAASGVTMCHCPGPPNYVAAAAAAQGGDRTGPLLLYCLYELVLHCLYCLCTAESSLVVMTAPCSAGMHQQQLAAALLRMRRKEVPAKQNSSWFSDWLQILAMYQFD